MSEMGELELLRRIADAVRMSIETGGINPASYMAITWRDYAERYQTGPVTEDAQEVFRAAGIDFAPKAALQEAQPPAPQGVASVPCPFCGAAVSFDDDNEIAAHTTPVIGAKCSASGLSFQYAEEAAKYLPTMDGTE